MYVSILTQPRCWVQLGLGGCRFQSSPNLLAGRSISLRDMYPIGQSVFNPHTTSWLGAARPDRFQSSPNLSAGCRSARYVSILAQPLGWVLVCCVSILAQPLGWAQHHRGSSKAGRCIFQSSPSISAGCASPQLFQSSPNLLAGCWFVSILTELLVRVSILAQPFGGAG